MKSYVCLFVACLPLFYIAGMETKSLGEKSVETLRKRSEQVSGETQLTKENDTVKKFAKIDRALIDGALGITPLSPDLAATGAGLELTLSEKYAPYARTVSVVKKFVDAFEKMTVLPPDALDDTNPAEHQLRTMLVERKKMAKAEEAVLKILTTSKGIPGEQKKEAKKYASSEYCDTALVQKIVSKLGNPRWTQKDAMREGSVLVLVIKTRDLLEEKETARKLDDVLKEIGKAVETKDALIGGTFCLVTSNSEPAGGRQDNRYVDWPGPDFYNDTDGVFDRDNARGAFVKALEAAELINGLRPTDSKIASVRIIYRSETITAQGPGRNAALPQYVSLSKVGTLTGVHWIASTKLEKSDLLDKWFPDDVRAYGHNDNYLEDLTGGLMQDRRRP